MLMLRVLQKTPATRERARSRMRCAGRPSIIRYQFVQRRSFLNLPDVLVPPVVFGGLFVGLWTWKCIMMVTFQNKIIYMPGLPPNSRWEKINDYKDQCQGVQWREERIKSIDQTRISLCVASVTSGEVTKPARTVYRGYWTSKGRPTEKGIALDAAAALQWIKDDFNLHSNLGDKEKAPVVFWGQSIGAGVATSLAAQQELFSQSRLSLETLILETPFLSIKAMLETLYPQKWLPYRYLWPFLRNHLDSSKALGVMQERYQSRGINPPKILILEAGRDELVPQQHGNMLEKRCQELGLEVSKTVIRNAYHTEVLVRPGGIAAVVEALEGVAEANEKGR